MTIINRNKSNFIYSLLPAVLSSFVLILRRPSIESLESADYAWALSTIIWLYAPVAYLATYKYLQIDGKHIILRNSPFKNIEFTTDQVESITLNFSPFSWSYFNMKNNSKIKFDEWSISEKDVKKLNLITPNIK